MNILIATPGRLLQHMDQTTSFDTSNLQLLVLDEADRILDLGFSKTMNAIIQNLPPSSLRQTLLFSATQTNNVQSLARLSLKEPIYIHVKDSENASTSVRNLQDTSQADNDDKSMETPTGLEQHYMLVDLDKKLDTLWSFVKSHLACKTIVFMSSCKQVKIKRSKSLHVWHLPSYLQVRFAYETFRHLRPGISLLHMHGKQKQSQRLAIYSRFTSSDKCVLFATDVAARGLDFPSVTWVVQLDCPEDVETYIHRVGRTARYQSKGKALLMLHQSEQPGFLKKLKEKNLFDRVGLIKANQNKQQSIQKQFQSLAFQYPEIKFLAQRAFISYVRSIHLQKHKTIFKVSELPLDKFAQSLGLAGTPQIKFLTKKEASEKKNKAREVENLKLARPVDSDDPVGQAGSGGEESVSSSSEDIGEEDETFIKNGVPPPVVSKAGISSKTTQYDKMYKRKNQGILSDHYTTVLARDDPEGDKRSLSLVGRDDLQEEFITLARPKDNMAGENMDTLDNADGMSLSGHEDLSKRQLKLGLTKKGLHKLRGQGDKLIFDEAGQGHALYELIGEDDIKDVGKERREFVEQQARNMKDVDVLDKEAIKNLKREKKRKRKEREREVDGKIVGGMDELVPSNPDQDEEEDAVKDIDFGDLPTDVENEFGRPAKKGKTKQKYVGDVEVEGDLEAMALSALRKVRK